METKLMSDKKIKLNDYVKHVPSNKVYIVYDSALVKRNGEYVPVFDCYPIRFIETGKGKGKTFHKEELTLKVEGGVIA